MKEELNNFKDLKVWQKGIDIVKEIYSLSNLLPRNEKFGLISQMRRCAISIPSNIAEGFKRYHNKEFKQFLYIALGSAAELETQLIICKELNYLTDLKSQDIFEKLDHLSRMSTNLLRKVSD